MFLKYFVLCERNILIRYIDIYPLSKWNTVTR